MNPYVIKSIDDQLYDFHEIKEKGSNAELRDWADQAVELLAGIRNYLQEEGL